MVEQRAEGLRHSWAARKDRPIDKRGSGAGTSLDRPTGLVIHGLRGVNETVIWTLILAISTVLKCIPMEVVDDFVAAIAVVSAVIVVVVVVVVVAGIIAVIIVVV
jgi:hypothetical protein